MTLNKTLSDQNQRQQALNVHESFLIQAPAGSGKTELLIQRFLKLLSTATKNPEEIIAITFTRKAAGEMRQRIVEALQFALEHSQPPAAAHQKQTWTLATAVLKKDAELQWKLLENPNRFKILTIDAFCARLTRQMPILSNFGAQPTIEDNISELFEKASDLVLQTLEEDVPWSDSLACLLSYLDNDQGKVQRLFVSMLHNRDQWLPYVINNNPRQQLEASLQHVIAEHMLKLENALSSIDQAKLVKQVIFAANNLMASKSQHPLSAYAETTSLFPLEANYLPQWQALASLLLKKDGSWRSRFSKNEGFPAASSAKNKEEKERFDFAKVAMSELMANFNDNLELHDAFSTLLDLPSPCYSDDQWQLIETLVNLLPILVAQLHVLFKQSAAVDHTEIALKALEALGTPDNPTDLTLALDYQIKHILVDEFQDTSVNQFRLLELLTAGWEKQNGRTLFLVGDPMQSIYRFRKAEVGLFLQARDQGINEVKLTFLQLSVNFRSNKNIINWNNNCYKTIFPKHDDLALSAVTYAASEAFNIEDAQSEVCLHPNFYMNRTLEADRIFEIIQKCYKQNPQQSIAILVSARSHLIDILPKLKEHNLAYRAVELENLYSKPVIQDLLALTKALTDLSNSVAWYAILRAPWCGLELADLLIIKQAAEGNIIFSALSKYKNLDISAQAKQQLQRIYPILNQGWLQLKDHSLSYLIESIWMALGGPASLKTDADYLNCQRFFDCLANFEVNNDSNNLHLFENLLANLTAESTTPQGTFIDVMTVHKSKGLEFDTVIIPGLDKATKADDHQLLVWQEIPSGHNKMELLLAPIKSSKEDSIYDYIRHLEKKKLQNELYRLLYVATTRAKTNLHLLFNVEVQEDDHSQLKPPRAGSLLAQLWPAIHQQLDLKNFDPARLEASINEELATYEVSFKRLPSQWQSPIKLDSTIKIYQSLKSLNINRYYANWSFETERILGIVIHKLIEIICTGNLNRWQNLDNNSKTAYAHKLITEYHIPLVQHQQLLDACLNAIDTIFADEFGHWVLTAPGSVEYKLQSINAENNMQTNIIDRLIETEQELWIIDFKTAVPKDMDREVFIQKQIKKYQEQLDSYEAILRKTTRKQIHKVLYFPLVAAYVSI